MTNTERPSGKDEMKKEMKVPIQKIPTPKLTQSKVEPKKINETESKDNGNQITESTDKPTKETSDIVKPETRKEIIEDIKESGVPEEVAKKEEALDEKAIKEI